MRFKQFVLGKAASQKVPASGVFELTPRCNMNCRMCYIRMTEEEMKPLGREMSAEEWCNIFDQAYENGLLYLLFTGGEVFLRKDFEEIYTYAYKKGTILSVNSNATMINEKHIEFLEKMPPELINITLYGADNEMYKNLCLNPNGFSQVTRTLNMLKEAKIRFMLNCSVTTLNRGELDKIIATANEFGCELNIAVYMFPPVRKTHLPCVENIRLTAEQAGETLAYLNARKMPDKMEELLSAYKSNIVVPGEEMICPDTMTRCLAGRSSYWVTWNGKLKACAMFDDEVDINGDFKSAWDKLTKMTDEIRLPGECTSCPEKPFCKTCAAVNCAEGGDFLKKPEFMCKMAKSYISNTEKYLKEFKK